MAGIGPGDLWALADELLDVATEALDTIPANFPSPAYLDELEGAPVRRFVSPGAPLPDCSQLCVHVNNITDRFARTAEPAAPKLNVPSLIVTLLRCVHAGSGEGDKWKPPTPAQQNADSQQLYADGWALWNHIYNLIRHEPRLFLETCSRADFVSMQSIAPEAGLAGWQLAFLVQLNGYDEDLGT